MALLAVFTGRECLFSIMARPAVLSCLQGFHGQGVIRIGASLFFLEQSIMAVTTPRSRSFMGIVIEHHGSEAFGVLVHDASGLVIRQNRRPTPQQTDCDKYRQIEHPHSNFHRSPFSNIDIS